jgi:hypothetical protein
VQTECSSTAQGAPRNMSDPEPHGSDSAKEL